ncbi:hypothetical protein LG329_16885 [Virgibacillus necropolis]|uniref:CBO0543 family protein n=1 Tax=Virgibacillus necropolis TaxID=163877 RepID=UPI00384F4F34
MESVILWAFFIIGIALLCYSLKKLPFKEWILVYLLTSYFSIVIGVLVVEENMLYYPVKFLNEHFESNLLFEYLWFPIITIYFYRTTYHSRYFGILLQGVLYISVLTFFEMLFEKYTDIIEYHTWTWMHTFASALFLIIFIRTFVKLYSHLNS